MRSLTFFPLVLSSRRHHGNTNLMLFPNYTKLMATKHCSMSSAVLKRLLFHIRWSHRGREPNNRKIYHSFLLKLSVILISSEANRHCLLESVAGLSLAWHHMLCIKRIAVYLRCIVQHECNRT